MFQKGLASILIVLLIAAAVGGYLVYSGKISLPQKQVTQTSKSDASPAPTGVDETANWKTYTNTKYGYSVKYPPDWSSGDGSFIAPGGQSGYGYSDVSIQVLSKSVNFDNTNREKDTLEEYVKKDAGGETGPSKTPISVKKITTQSGNIGFAVEWEASGWSANKKTYTAFFELPNDKTSTIQIGGTEGYLDVYHLIVSTFKFTE